MEGQERIAFEEQLSQSTELQEAVQLHQLEQEAMRLLEREQLRTQFSAWKEEKNLSTQQEAKVVAMKSSNRFRRLAIAASFLLLFGGGLSIWNQINNSDAALATNYFPITSTSDRSNINSENPLLDILTPLSKKDYNTAISAAELLENTIYREQTLLLKAEALFLKEDFNRAIETYESVIAQNNNISNQEKAEWGKILALLKSDKEKEAQNELKKIADNANHAYQQEAIELQNELNSIWNKLSW